MKIRLLAVTALVLTGACGHHKKLPKPDHITPPPAPACDQQALALRFGSDALNFQACEVQPLVEMFGKEARGAYVDCQGFQALTGTWQMRVQNWERLVTELKKKADSQGPPKLANAASVAEDLVSQAVVAANRAHREDMIDVQLLKKVVNHLENAVGLPEQPFPDCQAARRNGTGRVAASCVAAGTAG